MSTISAEQFKRDLEEMAYGVRMEAKAVRLRIRIKQLEHMLKHRGERLHTHPTPR